MTAATARARVGPGDLVDRDLVIAAQAGGREERRELVDALMPAIGRIARLYRGSAAVTRLELTQEGVLGVMRALERYDPAMGTPFWAYASWWVRQAMQQLVSQLTRPVVLSDRAVRQLARIKRARNAHLQQHGEDPTVVQLAKATGFSRQKVESLVAASRHPRALEEPVGREQGGGTLSDMLADPRAEDEYERVPRRVEVAHLHHMLAELNDRERTVVCGRYGFAGRQCTLRELGSGLGVTAERVRQIEQQALDKLRAAATAAVPPPARPSMQ